jgi:YidC/Oxa1 family membrane protein insertase
MKVRTLLIVFLVGFTGLCAGFVIESGLFSNTYSGPLFLLAQETNVQNQSHDPCMAQTAPTISSRKSLTADNTQLRTFTLGSTDPCSGYKFQIELTNEAAAVSKATLSEFKTRGTAKKEPLTVMQSITSDTGIILPMAAGNFVFVNEGLQLPLGRLNWQSSDIVRLQDGSEQVSFEAMIKDDMATPVVKVIKTYKIARGSYEMDCTVDVENLSKDAVTTRFDMFGPAGIESEDVRGDIRVMGAYIGQDQLIETAKLDEAAIKKAGGTKTLEPPKKDAQMIWTAVINKYFALITRPVPMAQTTVITSPDYVISEQAKTGYLDMTAVDSAALYMQIAPITLAAAGTDASSQTYKFQVFIGPKERDLFDKNPVYNQLGYIHTIEFGACCSLGFINTLAFAILALMKVVHNFLPFLNYGWIIIILVLLVRLVLHPVTKSSQISMMKMGKLGPQAEEIRKKYADNKQEMNRRIMELYKAQGASPILGCLPMLLQMPIWIALYSAIYAGIELRGAEFLPFWITDLSGSDAIFTFHPVTIPLIGVISSFNLLPILLAIAMYLQQKLTPTSTQAGVSEQMRQQQKMMLIMMPIMMLLFLYNAPSGLNLYIMASTFGGVIEQYFIRKHIREKEAAEAETLVSATAKIAKVKKKKPKPFFRF